MPRLEIPLRYRPPLHALAELSGERADRLVDAVTGAAPLLEVAQLERLSREAFGDEAWPNDLELLVPALVSLRGRLRELEVDQLARAASMSRDLALSTDARETLKGRLRALLGSDAISSTANAIELLTHNERNYSTARVLTDVRHVFREEAAERPLGAVIIEVLAIETWNKDERDETIYIAMDERDLHELRAVAERALDKTKNLRSMLGEQELPYFELDKREI